MVTAAAGLVIELKAQVMFALPAATPVTKPVELTVATEGLEDSHVAIFAMFCVELSDHVLVQTI